MNVHPDAPRHAAIFDPEASYELKFDPDGDADAEIAFHVQFSPAVEGRQVATVYRITGAAARDTGPLGEAPIRDAKVSFDGEAQVTTAGAYRFYAGLRSDPWFADVDGIFDNFQFTRVMSRSRRWRCCRDSWALDATTMRSASSRMRLEGPCRDRRRHARGAWSCTGRTLT